MNKQETIEEAAIDTTKKYINEREKQTAYLEFIEGTKWQAEQDKNKYNEEDMKQFAWECVANFLSNNDNKVEMALIEVIIDRNNKQFEKFKKK